MKINVGKLLISIAIPLLVGGAAAFFTRGAMGVFETMEQPPLSPPSWLFPVVWTILYTLMGVSYYLISQGENQKNRIGVSVDGETIAASKRIYFLQLLLNFLWPIFFFDFGWYLFSFFVLVALWIAVAIMIRKFADISQLAALLNIPYLLWLTFAAYLNLGVWWLNR